MIGVFFIIGIPLRNLENLFLNLAASKRVPGPFLAKATRLWKICKDLPGVASRKPWLQPIKHTVSQTNSKHSVLNSDYIKATLCKLGHMSIALTIPMLSIRYIEDREVVSKR